MTVRPPRGRAVIFALCAWLGCAACGAGCAHIPPWKKAIPTAPLPGPPADAPADSVCNPTTLAPEVPVEITPIKRKPLEKTVEPPPADTLSAPAEPTPGGSPTGTAISVDLPPAERAQLTETTRRELEQTLALARSIETRNLSPAEEEKLRTIQALVQSSREATDRGEVPEAANLAHKAWILAVEMSERR